MVFLIDLRLPDSVSAVCLDAPFGDVKSAHHKKFTAQHTPRSSLQIREFFALAFLADGESRGIFDLSTDGPRIPQQKVCTVKDLPSRPDHTITVVNRGGRVAVDAFVTEQGIMKPSG